MPIGTLEAIQQGGLVLYACLKAFLPLPSLEVVLIPLILKNPDGWLLYAMEGAVGTAIGGWIGYQIARRAQQAVLRKFASEQEIASGRQLMDRYGVLAVFIGGVTPIPDFLLAYLAGMTQMALIPFLLSDGTARLLRSVLVGWCIRTLGYVVDISHGRMAVIALGAQRRMKPRKKASVPKGLFPCL